MRSRLRLSTLLGVTHGVLVALLLVMLVVTLQGLLRMTALIADVRDCRLSTVDAEEELHRAAWGIEVRVRHARVACSAGAFDDSHVEGVKEARARLVDLDRQTGAQIAPRLREAATAYLGLADAVITPDPCSTLLSPDTEDRRAAFDKELHTNAWIDRLYEVHAEIERKEEAARGIGVRTAVGGLLVAAAAAVAALLIARSTARSVAGPIAALSSFATRIGDGDFEPVARVAGPLEVEELWRDLDKMREKIRELDRLKQNVIASVSHELRSPLARVNEALALLADGTCGPLTQKQERVVTLAVRACHREVRLVDALLDMSRLKAGRPLLREAACDIDRVLETAVAEERSDAAERGVTVEVEKDGPAPSIAIDSALVERAVANLVRNAVSVSSRGQRVVVHRRLSGDAVPVVEIAVSDDGPGLPELRAELFRPFSARTVAAANRPAGIGLGLSFAREVARAHQGDITVARSDETGTTFRMHFPLTIDGEA